MAISQDYIFELTQRNDIVDVIGSNVQLRKRGRTYTGLCPFHNEKTPSFVVYPETQSFYCFGCGAGGDAITFVKQMNNLDYIEAVKFLAARAGMALPEENDEQGRIKKRIYEINKEVARFYVACLNEERGMPARRYLRGRALSDSTIRRFGLGYSPDSFFDTKNYLLKKGYTEYELLQAGVVKKSERGHTYDVFRNRVMFPIIDLRGNVIAFGGRNMGDEKPKYLNSGDTPVFKKSRNLFALNLAKKQVERRYILAEGYMDVIAMHQAEFSTAIATLGTALTEEQANIIAKYADEVVISYDSDEAGQKATRRAIDIFNRIQMKVSVLSIPNAKDPDEFIKKFGAERFQMLLDGSNNAIEYGMLKAKAKYDITTDDGRLGYIKDAIGILSGQVSATERDVYAGRLAEETGIAKNAILNQMESSIRARQNRARKEREKALLQEGVQSRVNVSHAGGGSKALGVAFSEQQLVAAMLKNDDFYPLVRERIGPQQFISPDMQQVYEAICRKKQAGESIDFSLISMELPSETIALLSRIMAQNYDVGFSRRDVEMHLQRIQDSVPVSVQAADLSAEDIAQRLKELGDKKR